MEAAISYTGDITDPSKTKFTLDYYLELARKLVDVRRPESNPRRRLSWSHIGGAASAAP